PPLHDALPISKGRFINDDDFNLSFRNAARALLGRMQRRARPEFYTASRPFELKDSSAVWQLVVCNDEPMPNTDGKFWVDKAFELARKAPVADIMLASQPCLHWNRAQPVSRKPPMASLEHAKLLMVQTEFDVPTP